MKLRNLKIAGGLAFLAICLLVTAVPGALAQAGRGSISGTITDPSGAIVPGARVTLLNPGTGVSLHAVTTAGGLYTFISLNPGVYEVTVSQSGFTTAQRENVTVTVDQTTIVDIALSMGSVSTVVK
ncbi:MAG: carboxypeptidase-like regulatory domain-containing protein, partial [Acidobacteriaceae bacterium]